MAVVVAVAVGVGVGVGEAGSVTTLVVVLVPSLIVKAKTCVTIARPTAVPASIFEFLVMCYPIPPVRRL